ncbi:MAG: hypothetical protein WC628_03880 [Candidatus Omnitrophota bacterium]
MRQIDFHKVDYMRLIAVGLTVVILFKALPVHFFADNAEMLYLAKYYSKNFLELFSPFPHFIENHSYLHLQFIYRINERLFFTIAYLVGRINPLPYNMLQGALFLILTTSLYNLTRLFSGNKVASLLSVLIFVVTPPNYKSLHWLGTSSLSVPALTLATLYFILSAVRKNSYARLWVGLAIMLLIFCSMVSAIITVTLLLAVFTLLYPEDVRSGKRIFSIAMISALIIGIFTLILHQTAFNRELMIKYQANFYKLYNISPNYMLRNLGYFWSAISQYSFPQLLFLCLGLFAFNPSKDAFIALVLVILQLAPFLIVNCYTTRYFPFISVGLSMFIAIIIVSRIESIFQRRQNIKIKFCHLALIILFLSGLTGKAVYENVGKIKYVFSLVKPSFRQTEENIQRLASLPKKSVVCFDEDISGWYYAHILKAMDRRDIRIDGAGCQDKVNKELFFEGQVHSFTDTNGMCQFTDKFGDWRF